MQVTINANNRVLNAKLVQFNPKGFKTFIIGMVTVIMINLKKIYLCLMLMILQIKVMTF
jgi:hypothetical protein